MKLCDWSFYILLFRQKAPARVPVPLVAQPLMAVHLNTMGNCNAHMYKLQAQSETLRNQDPLASKEK